MLCGAGLNLRDRGPENCVEFKIADTSGHADTRDLTRFVDAIRSRRLIPIHALRPERYAVLGPSATPLGEGVWIDVSSPDTAQGGPCRSLCDVG